MITMKQKKNADTLRKIIIIIKKGNNFEKFKKKYNNYQFKVSLS